jgi:hypothetical protein
MAATTVICGHVYFLPILIARKDKLVVPAFVGNNGRVRFFVINTNKTDYQENNPDICRHVIPVPREGNDGFLDRDSWLTCHEVIGGWTVSEIEAREGCYRGPLDEKTIAAVRQLITDTRLHPEPDKIAILSQWPQ